MSGHVCHDVTKMDAFLSPNRFGDIDAEELDAFMIFFVSQVLMAKHRAVPYSKGVAIL